MKSTAAMLALACLAVAPAVSVAQSATREESAARFVAEHLDVLSIPSSLYARRRPGANTLKDYGFIDFEKADGGVRSIDQARRWLFAVKIIEDNGGLKILCIQDQPFTGVTTGAQNAFEVKLGADGLFHGTGRIAQSEQCPPFQR
jgi:pyridoxal biosynthesis lyase PdxS